MEYLCAVATTQGNRVHVHNCLWLQLPWRRGHEHSNEHLQHHTYHMYKNVT